MSPAVQVCIAGAGTYLLRLSGIAVLSGGRRLPPRLERGLRHVAPAVLASLIANALLIDDGGLRALGTWHVAALVAGATAAWKKRFDLTLVVGAITLWTLNAVT